MFRQEMFPIKSERKAVQIFIVLECAAFDSKSSLTAGLRRKGRERWQERIVGTEW